MHHYHSILSYKKLGKTLLSDCWRKSNPGFFCDWPDIENREGESTIVFQCKIHLKCMKKRDACRTVRIHELELLFRQFRCIFKEKGKKDRKKMKKMSDRAKRKKSVNLIYCFSYFKTFLFVLWFNLGEEYAIMPLIKTEDDVGFQSC